MTGSQIPEDLVLLRLGYGAIECGCFYAEPSESIDLVGLK